MNAPYDPLTVRQLMLDDKLSAEHAIGEAIWRSTDRALSKALTFRTGWLANILTENKTNKVWPIVYKSPNA